MNLDFWRFIHPYHFVIVEIALLDGAPRNGDLAVVRPVSPNMTPLSICIALLRGSTMCPQSATTTILSTASFPPDATVTSATSAMIVS